MKFSAVGWMHRANYSILLSQIPVRKVMPWQEDVSKNVMGSNPGAGKGFFLC